ncbi:MAG TPA: hypothetical protein VKU01_20665 [Bryobacteraceae bacterium]|nr:hypothetical protein [Bryobacteraceae bacterium]
MTQRSPLLKAGAGSVSSFAKVYTPAELGALWKLSDDSIRRLFQDEPGVFRLGNPNARKKRSYLTLRIPESVAERVWQEHMR